MLKFYLVPVETIDNGGRNKRGPAYFYWTPTPPGFTEHPGIITRWGMMDYGFMPSALLCTPEISQTDHDSLALHSDVYAFPDNLDAAITDPNIDTFFETINIPADWLTPATTYRELMRQTGGMFVFNQRYNGISQGHSIINDAGGLNTRYNTWSQQTRSWFDETLASLNYPPVTGNPQLRQLIKQAASLWGNKPFYLSGIEF